MTRQELEGLSLAFDIDDNLCLGLSAGLSPDGLY